MPEQLVVPAGANVMRYVDAIARRSLARADRTRALLAPDLWERLMVETSGELILGHGACAGFFYTSAGEYAVHRDDLAKPGTLTVWTRGPTYEVRT